MAVPLETVTTVFERLDFRRGIHGAELGPHLFLSPSSGVVSPRIERATSGSNECSNCALQNRKQWRRRRARGRDQTPGTFDDDGGIIEHWEEPALLTSRCRPG